MINTTLGPSTSTHSREEESSDSEIDGPLNLAIITRIQANQANPATSTPALSPKLQSRLGPHPRCLLESWADATEDGPMNGVNDKPKERIPEGAVMLHRAMMIDLEADEIQPAREANIANAPNPPGVDDRSQATAAGSESQENDPERQSRSVPQVHLEDSPSASTAESLGIPIDNAPTPRGRNTATFVAIKASPYPAVLRSKVEAKGLGRDVPREVLAARAQKKGEHEAQRRPQIRPRRLRLKQRRIRVHPPACRP